MNRPEDAFINDMVNLHKFCTTSQKDCDARSKTVANHRQALKLKGAAGAYGECELRLRVAIEKFKSTKNTLPA